MGRFPAGGARRYGDREDDVWAMMLRGGEIQRETATPLRLARGESWEGSFVIGSAAMVLRGGEIQRETATPLRLARGESWEVVFAIGSAAMVLRCSET